MAVGNTADAIFSPAVGARAGVFVREVLPSRSARAIVFAHRTPLPFREIRAPALPIFFPGAIFLEALVFFGLQSGHGLEPSVGMVKLWFMVASFANPRGDRYW